MKRRKIIKLVTATTIVILILIIGFVSYIVGSAYFFVKTGVKEANTRRTILLYKTDHRALLKACRIVAQKKNNGQLKTEHMYSIRGIQDQKVDFPKALLDLNPSYIVVFDSGVVKVEMFGGMDHFGVHAYPSDFDISDYPPSPEDIMLIEGLWYYDEVLIDGANPKEFLKHFEPE
jgi:hypothetical protein